MKVLRDLDTGIDDALAILYLADAARRGEAELVGAGTVGGNVEVAKTTRNTLKVCELADLEVPVAAGAEKPVLMPLNAAGSRTARSRRWVRDRRWTGAR